MEVVAVVEGDGFVRRSEFLGRVPWWSFSKTVLAIAALRLVENDEVSLDDKIKGERFSLRQLLQHEAGLPDYAALTEYRNDVAAGKAPWPVRQLLATLDAGRLRYEPGTAWAYSNIGYFKVSQLIEQTYGRELAVALAELVFKPAGLETARLAVEIADLADVHTGGHAYHPGWVYHGLIVGTVTDAVRLLWLLVTNKILEPDTLAEMMRRRALPEYRSALHPDPAYGLGLMLSANDPKLHPLGHSGEGPGSKIAVYAKGGRAVSVWTPLPSRVDAEVHAFQLLHI